MWPGTVREALGNVREFGRGTGRGHRITGKEASWGYVGIEPGPAIGMQVNQYNAGNANPNVRADGRPRGPAE